MISKLLLATDLSAAADRAMERAQHIAIEHGAKIFCVSAVEPVGGHPSFDVAGREDLVRKHLQATALGAYCVAQVAVSVGSVESVIAGFEELLRPDMIVLGDSNHPEGRGLHSIIDATRGAVLVVRGRALAPYGRAITAKTLADTDLVDALVRHAAAGDILRVTDRTKWLADASGAEDVLVLPS